MNHKYRIGDSVSFVRRSVLLNKISDDYSVVRLMPNDDHSEEPQYRLKSKGETCERVAQESDLYRSGGHKDFN